MAMVMKNVKLEQDVMDELKKLAQIHDRDTSYMIRKAVNDLISSHKWQIEQSLDTLKKVESGEMVTHTHEDIEQWMKEEGMVE